MCLRFHNICIVDVVFLAELSEIANSWQSYWSGYNIEQMPGNSTYISYFPVFTNFSVLYISEQFFFIWFRLNADPMEVSHYLKELWLELPTWKCFLYGVPQTKGFALSTIRIIMFIVLKHQFNRIYHIYIACFRRIQRHLWAYWQWQLDGSKKPT